MNLSPQANRDERSLLATLLHFHRDALSQSWRHLMASPVLYGLTILTLGIALSLPATLYVLYNNLEPVVEPIRNNQYLSVYLDLDSDEAEVTSTIDTLKGNSNITDVTHITPAEALKTLETQSGIDDAIQLLPSNPLPHIIEITPTPEASSLEQLALLKGQLESIASVDYVEMSAEWIQKLQTLLDNLKRTLLLFSLLFMTIVSLVILLTIKLDLLHRKAEIEVIQLVGGGYDYIQRPFIYRSLLIGTLSGIIAVLALWGVHQWLSPWAELLIGAGQQLSLPGLIWLWLPLTSAILCLIATLAGLKLYLHLTELMQ